MSRFIFLWIALGIYGAKVKGIDNGKEKDLKVKKEGISSIGKIKEIKIITNEKSIKVNCDE